MAEIGHKLKKSECLIMWFKGGHYFLYISLSAFLLNVIIVDIPLYIVGIYFVQDNKNCPIFFGLTETNFRHVCLGSRLFTRKDKLF